MSDQNKKSGNKKVVNGIIELVIGLGIFFGQKDIRQIWGL
jgi:hypothetical protein